MAKYKKNFLAQVILRLDFTKEIEQSETCYSKFYDGIKGVFPNKKIDTSVTVKATFLDKKFEQSQEESPLYTFTNIEETKILTLEKTDLVITYVNNSYTDFSELSDTIKLVINSFYSAYGNMIVKRTGLRYINNFYLPEGDPLDWSNLIDKRLLQLIEFVPDKKELSQVLGVLVLNKSYGKLRIVSGLFNSEYPNKIAKKEFILDYDCFSEYENEVQDIPALAKTLNDEITKLFELSIQDGMRYIMNEG